MTRLKLKKNSLIERAAVRTTMMVVLGASLSLSACSFVPDWGNPVVWYDSVVGGIGGNSDAPPKADAEAVRQVQGQTAIAASDSKNFPSLKTVPQQVPQTSSSEERRRVAQGLVADRDNAKYTDQVLRAGGTPKPQSPPTQIATVAPTPSSKPVTASSAAVPQPAQASQTPRVQKPVAAAPAPKSVATPKPVMPTPAPVQRVARARLPKLDLQPTSRTQVAAVPAPPPSAVPQSQTTAPAPVPRPIVEPERGSQPPAPYPPLAGSVPARGASSIVQSDYAPAPAPMASSMPPLAVPSVVPVQPVAPMASQPPMDSQPESQQASITGLGGADGVLTQAFSQALAQSASTVTTAPAGTSFGAPSAAPLTVAQTSVPDIVRDTYNQTLIAGSGVASSATAASGTSIAAAPAGPATVFFNNGSSGLNSKAKALIRNVADSYKARRGSLRIVGHASSRTRNLPVQRHKIVNFRISLDRATAVANELIKLGVDKSAIQIAAVSDSQPVFFESMPEGEAGNRRAEIFYAF